MSLLVVGALACHETTSAQTEYEPFRIDTGLQPIQRNNFARVGFDKHLGTYQWMGIVRLDTSAGPLSFAISEQFRSTIIQTPRKLIRDEQFLDVRAKHTLVDRLAATVRFSNFALSDDQRVTDGQRPSLTTASSNGVYGGIQAEPFDRVFIEPVAGMRYENQAGIRDNGFSFAVAAWVPGRDVGGYRTALEGRFQRDLLLPRTLERRSLTAGVQKAFFGRTRDTLQVSYTSNQRDFYLGADTNAAREFNITNNIERRVDEVLAITNLLEYGVGDRVLVSFLGNLSSRTIDREFRYRSLASPPTQTLVNTTVSEFRIGGAGRVVYEAGDDLAAGLELLIQERDERHTVGPDDRIPALIDLRARDEAKKDNLSRRTMLASTVNLALSRSDRLFFSGSTSLLRYDTPSDDNFDDRDELWYSFNFITTHQINSHLNLRISADANLTHLVYLLKERSANNTWNRVFRLAPRVHYVPSGDFSTINTFEVLANYTVYDFEGVPGLQVRSFSFRQFAWIDSSRLSLTSRLGLEGFAYIRLYERGELRWDTFRERPVNYFEDKTIIGRLSYSPSRRLILSAGVRYFSQIRFGYAGGTRTFESLLKSVGPLGALDWEFGERSRLAIDGWYEHQTQTNAPPRGFTNMVVSLSVFL